MPAMSATTDTKFSPPRHSRVTDGAMPSKMTRGLRVNYFSPSIIPSRYANSVHVMQMCAGLANNGAEVTLFGIRGAERGVSDPFAFYGLARTFKLYMLPWPPIVGRVYVATIWGAIRARLAKIDIVFGRCIIGVFFSSFLGCRVILETHLPTDELSKVERWMLRRLFKSARFVGLVVISTVLKRHYDDTHNLPEGMVIVAPDAAGEPKGVQPASIGRADRLQVGYVGHLYEGRGVNIIHSLAKQCDFADFHVIGGDDEDVAMWRERTRDVENLTFHGFVPPGKTAAYRAACHVLIAPYQRKVTIAGQRNTVDWMSPLKLFEYMSSAKAILCSDLPVLHEVMTDEQNCLMCTPDDTDNWRRALERLRDDPSLRQSLGTNAYGDFRENYTWTVRAKRIFESFGYSL